MKNKGLRQYRFKQIDENLRERAFALAWERQHTQPNSLGRGTLDYLLADDPNHPAGEVTDRDRVVAATVIQWLGSPVGQCFVQEVQDAFVKGKRDE